MSWDTTEAQAESKVTGPSKSVNAAGPLVVLWDIDGTLLSSDGAGRWAMETAFRDLFGIARALQEIELAGRTDEAILLDAARSASLTLSDGDREQFRAHYARLLGKELSSGRRRPHALPGVTRMLASLARDPRFLSGLLTGNWERSAYIKLAAVRLDGWFRFGAYAGDAPTREDLLPVALNQAQRTVGVTIPARRAVIVGDTPRDVTVAIRHGASSIAVATGPHRSEELAASGPDLLVDDLTDRRVTAMLVEWYATR